MEVQYQIMELDNSHLKQKEYTFESPSDRICFIPAKLAVNNIQDSMEEALEALKNHGNDFAEYTIIPRIYMAG